MTDTTHLAETAARRLEAAGEPRSALEDWRYVRWRPAAELEPAAPDGSPIDATEADLVLVDGTVVSAPLPELRTEPDAEDRSILERALIVGERADLVTIADAATVLSLDLHGMRARPLRIVQHCTGGRGATRIHLRAAPGAVADVSIETRHHAPAVHHTAIDVDAGAGAVLRLDQLEHGVAPEAIGVHLVARSCRVGRDAGVTWTTGLLGGTLVRHATRGELLGAGGELNLGGATVVDGRRQAHHLIRVFHRVGAARSRQDFKTLARDRGLASFDGLIHVDPGADDTDALQQCNNLLLDPGARVAVRPQLDIHTDEVVASHGATVGQVDPEELRYLCTRGIDPDRARSLIVAGFIRDGLASMASLRAVAETALLDRLPG